jgi:BirA family biotin operon repressor/biotin-[acetyl-CoA-carboxylase] ligase
VVREPPPLLSLTAGLAVAETVDAVRRDPGINPQAQIKWPNDVLIARGKVAGILVEARLQEHWAVLGIGLNVALRAQDLPPELGDRAATLGLEPTEIEPVLERLLERLTAWLPARKPDILAAVRDRDALLGQPVQWTGGSGTGAGIDDNGRLLVTRPAGLRPVALDAGEVHLG